jgi:hypothetical protein
MPRLRLELTSRLALLAYAALLVYMLGSMIMHIRLVDDSMRDAVRERLRSEYAGLSSKHIASVLAEVRADTRIPPIAPLLQHVFDFPSFAAHAKLMNRLTYVRALVTIDGGPPPDDRDVRYFALTPKFGGGWTVVGETTANTYYSELLP